MKNTKDLRMKIKYILSAMQTEVFVAQWMCHHVGKKHL